MFHYRKVRLMQLIVHHHVKVKHNCECDRSYIRLKEMSWWKQKQFCFKSDNAENDAGPCGQYVSWLVKLCHLCELRDPRRTLRCSGHQRWWAGLRGSGWGGPGAKGPSLYEEPEWSSHSGGTCIHHPGNQGLLGWVQCLQWMWRHHGVALKRVARLAYI